MVSGDIMNGYSMISMTGTIEEVQSVFPTLNFFVQLESGESIQLPLIPLDYVEVDSMFPNRIKISFAADNTCPLTIGQGLLSRIALHIDPSRGRIGFADPSN